MSIPINIKKKLQEIPSVDLILEKYKNFLVSAPYTLYKSEIRSELNNIRNDILTGNKISNISDYTYEKVYKKIQFLSLTNLKSVINGTGIILHTGLGRAPISNELFQKACSNVMQYTNLELDLVSGKRGERNNHVETLISSITGSEASVIVNNNAAAVLIMLNSLAEGKEVIISRGEQVEIGGSFRIPDVIKKSGCKMVEIGTTNKTHLRDYENAINSNTGAILVAHTSNYKVIGFTKSVELSDLSKLSKRKKIPLILDLGCGVVVDFNKLNLPYDEAVNSYIKSGAGVVAFSGDKLLGGPQSGIICGKKNLIKKIHKNPLYRALRADKFTFAILESTLRTYLTSSHVTNENLLYNLLKRTQEELLVIGNKILKNIPVKIIKKYLIKLKHTQVEVGSGSLPLEKIPSIALEFNGSIRPKQLSKLFRIAEYPIVGYIKENKFYIDLKAIPLIHEKQLIETIISTLK